MSEADEKLLRLELDEGTTPDQVAEKVKAFLAEHGLKETPEMQAMIEDLKAILEANRHPGPNQEAFSQAILETQGFIAIAQKVYTDCLREKPEDREDACHGAMHTMIEKLEELTNKIIGNMPCVKEGMRKAGLVNEEKGPTIN